MAIANPEALNSVVPIQAGAFAAPPPSETIASTLIASDAIFPSPASTAAGALSRNDHLVITFDDASDRTIYFESAVAENYGGSPITVNLFWAAATALFDDVEWFVSWERQNAGGPFDLDVNDFAPALSVVSTAPGTSGFLQQASIVFTQAQADAVAAGDCFRLRIRRDGGVGNDDMVGDAQLLRVTLEGI
jgi:hypothetical protein